MKKEGRWWIREATSGDAAGLKECMEQAFATYQARMGGERLPPMDVDYKQEVSDYPTWVAASDDSIVGGLIMTFGDTALIANVAVHPGQQGRGLGGELLRFAERMATERGYSELRLTTHVLLTENVSLYRHLGWRETARDGTRVFMSKKI